MEEKEFEMYVHILNNLPDCEKLINKYTSKKDIALQKPKQTTTISSHADASIPSITTVINTIEVFLIIILKVIVDLIQKMLLI